MRSIHARATLILLTLLALARPAPAAEPKLVEYVVRTGDTCWSIALRVYGEGEKLDLIHAYNKLGPMPHLLEPGQVLRLPSGGEHPVARIDWLKRDVNTQPPRAPDWREAHADMPLWRLYKVATGDESSARIAFEDRSGIAMRQEALLVVYASNRKSVLKRGRSVGQVRLERGSLHGGLARMDRESRIDIETPGADIGLRASSAEIQVDELKSSIVSVFEGVADVVAQGVEVMVKENQGTVVKLGAPPAPPRPLPAAPAWEDPTTQVALLTPAGGQLAFEARWLPVGAAARYRVELARDAAFQRVLMDRVVGSDVTRFMARELTVGDYYVRVASVGRDKLQSRPSPALRVHVRAFGSSRPLQRRDDVYEAVGLLRLAPALAEGCRLELHEDGEAPRPIAGPLSLVGPTSVTLATRCGDGEAFGLTRVRVLSVKAEFEEPAASSPGEELPVALRLHDERGRPAGLPGLEVSRSDERRALTLDHESAGRATTRVRIPGEPMSDGVRLCAAWPGGELAQVVAPIARPQAGAPPAAWIAPSPAPTWERAAPGSPTSDGPPMTRVGLGAGIWLPEAASADEDLVLRLDLEGELALLDRRLGLHVELPWYRLPLGSDRVEGRELGDLRLGARYRFEAARGLVIGPLLTTTLPTGDGFGAPARGWLEPGWALSWQIGDALRLDSAHALALGWAPDAGGAAAYGGRVGLAWRLTPALSLGAGFETNTALSEVDESDARFGLAATAGAWLTLARVRLGLEGGAGLHEGARRRMGRGLVSLLVELGY
jgi:hypothetical protein